MTHTIIATAIATVVFTATAIVSYRLAVTMYLTGSDMIKYFL